MINNNTLHSFLEQKTLYYDKIDFDVIKQSWQILSNYINLPYVIHIVGTNGKGSTGRFIASFLNQLNKKVLHYTSPHILEFNERIWINGKNSTYKELNDAHYELQIILPEEILNKLTYFEYTTLLALYLSNDLDYIVLEAGLGGEFDATNIVTNDLTVIPSIGLDHIEFLGDNIKDISTTKLRSCNNAYIMPNNINNIVVDVANDILKHKKKIIFDENITLPNGYDKLALYLQNNLKLAINTIHYLGYETKQLKIYSMNGRMQKIKKNITIDVGHNSLAAKVIVEEFKNKKIILIYNCFKDKDYKEVLKVFRPILKRVEIIRCNDQKIINEDIIIKHCNRLDIEVKFFNIKSINYINEYLVFGSFKVVEEFLKLKEKSEE